MKEKTTGRRSSSRVAWESLEKWARLEIQDWVQELMVAEVTELLGREKSERRKPVDTRCLRYLLLVMCAHPFAKEALTLHLARSEGCERYFDCKLMQHKVLASSHQHLMAEAPPILAGLNRGISDGSSFCGAQVFQYR